MNRLSVWEKKYSLFPLPNSLFDQRPVHRLRFDQIVRNEYHDPTHARIGGTMMHPHSSSNAPAMPLHHSFLDKIWYQWQKKGDDYKYAYFKSVTFKLPGSEYYGWEWMDSNNLPGDVKVLYTD